jgi:hypothetical protein
VIIETNHAVEVNEIVSEFIKSLMNCDALPSSILSGVHNAFVHGQLLEVNGYDISQENLDKFFKHMDACLKIMREIEMSKPGAISGVGRFRNTCGRRLFDPNFRIAPAP